MKKLVISIHKYFQLWNCEKWNKRDYMWFYTIICIMMIISLGIISMSYHIDELEAQNHRMGQIIKTLESECR